MSPRPTIYVSRRIDASRNSVLEQALILEGLVDSVVSVNIYADFTVLAQIETLCSCAIEDAVDKVGPSIMHGFGFHDIICVVQARFALQDAKQFTEIASEPIAAAEPDDIDELHRFVGDVDTTTDVLETMPSPPTHDVVKQSRVATTAC